jgi:protein-S-isoprenylcysteine O-methyltransferase Ste14
MNTHSVNHAISPFRPPSIILLTMPLQAADPEHWINILWLFWVVLWTAVAFTAKRTRTEEPAGARILYLIPIVLAAVLIFSPALRVGPLTQRFVPHSLALQWVGVAMTALGIAFTFWARVHIGRNWSGRVVIKEQHELIRTGPYASVRHPIYTGLLLAVAGTALAIGELRAVIAFALAAVHFVQKAKREERFMSREFGEEYARYRSQSGMLLPRLR